MGANTRNYCTDAITCTDAIIDMQLENQRANDLVNLVYKARLDFEETTHKEPNHVVMHPDDERAMIPQFGFVPHPRLAGEEIIICGLKVLRSWDVKAGEFKVFYTP